MTFIRCLKYKATKETNILGSDRNNLLLLPTTKYIVNCPDLRSEYSEIFQDFPGKKGSIFFSSWPGGAECYKKKPYLFFENFFLFSFTEKNIFTAPDNWEDVKLLPSIHRQWHCSIPVPSTLAGNMRGWIKVHMDSIQRSYYLCMPSEPMMKQMNRRWKGSWKVRNACKRRGPMDEGTRLRLRRRADWDCIESVNRKNIEEEGGEEE